MSRASRSNCSAAPLNASAPLRVRALRASRRHEAACSRRSSAASPREIRSVIVLLPKGPHWPEPLASDHTLDDLALELGTDLRRAMAAHAHQPHAAIGQRLERGNCDALVAAMLDDLGLGHREVEGAAHVRFRLAAAIASDGLE